MSMLESQPVEFFQQADYAFDVGGRGQAGDIFEYGAVNQLRILRDESDAAEVMQDTLLRYLSGGIRSQGPAQASACIT